MRNFGIKISVAVISVISTISLATAFQLQDGPADVPEPGMFGMFAGAVAVALIMTRVIKKK